jgi:NADPH:quinone reductase-like Zn-dependent oxidoreductase
MKAVQFSEYGEPEVLHVAEVDAPHAGPGQIRVAVRAAGVNPIDWKVRKGMMADGPLARPVTPGSDVAGVVDEVGEGVEDVAPGDAVFGFSIGGGAAEHTLLEHYARKPDGLSWEEAAGFPVAVETAARGLDLLGVGEGQTLLITGAAGGVGTATVQLARRRGARVIGTASEHNHDFLRSLGAEPTTYGDGLVERVRALAPDGVDRAFDTAGRGALPDLIELTGGPENVVTIADFSAPQLGVRVSSGGGTERAYYALAEAARLAQDGQFALPVERVFGFSEAADAQRLSEEGHVRGKLVLVPDAG